MNTKSRAFDLEDRLIQFASDVLDYLETLAKTPIGIYFSDQMSRSSVGSALNYGEAQAAESRRDFSHKMQVVLKELKETYIALKIAKKRKMGDQLLLVPILEESNQLCAIFTASVQKVKSKNLKP